VSGDNGCLVTISREWVEASNEAIRLVHEHYAARLLALEVAVELALKDALAAGNEDRVEQYRAALNPPPSARP
jgi:hypothetical protein